MTEEENINPKLHVFEIWRLRCLRSTQGHYISVNYFRKRDEWLTGFNVAFSIGVLALSSASLIIDAKKNWLSDAIELISISTVITSVLQYILDFRGRWKDHERAAASYAKMNREFESIRGNDAVNDADFDTLKQRLDSLAEISPTVPKKIWETDEQRKIKEDLDALEWVLVKRDVCSTRVRPCKRNLES